MVTFMAYAVGTISMAVAAVISAWQTHHAFYPTVQHMVATKLSLVVLMNCVLCGTIIFGKLLNWAFLSKLRDLEVEHLYEKLAYNLTESLLAIAMFREDFDAYLFGMLTTLIFLKIFHWIVSDRVEFIPQAPFVTVWTLVRLYSLMSFLLICDVVLLLFSVNSIVNRGFSIVVLFGFEFIVLATTMAALSVKLGLHCVDIYMMDGGWERKSAFVFYIDLVADVFNLTTYIIFFIAIMTAMGVPIHLIRDIYMTFRNLTRRINDLIRYRRATADMETRYPDATEAELESMTDRTCIVCREDLNSGKKLPCGHIFHMRCLRSWLERQQTCPTCRTDVLVQGQRGAAGGAAAPQAQRQPEPEPEAQAQAQPEAQVQAQAQAQPTHHVFTDPAAFSAFVHSLNENGSGSGSGVPTPIPVNMPMPMFNPGPSPSPSPGSALPPVNLLLDRSVPMDVIERLVAETQARVKVVESELNVLQAVLEARRAMKESSRRRRAARRKEKDEAAAAIQCDGGGDVTAKAEAKERGKGKGEVDVEAEAEAGAPGPDLCSSHAKSKPEPEPKDDSGVPAHLVADELD